MATTTNIKKVSLGDFFVGQGDIVMWDEISSYASATLASFQNGRSVGNVKEDSGTIDAPIARSKKDRKKMAIDPEGRPSITDWTVLSTGRAVTLLDVHILTGRTHQIRVHMKSLGHPVCGDPIYGSDRGARVSRLMLHAYSLSFTHPTTGERMTFTAPLPEAFTASLRSNGVTW